MREAYIVRGDGTVSRDASSKNIADALADHAARMWVDITLPDEDDIDLMNDVFHFHPLAIEDSTIYTQQPKIDHYDTDSGECPVGYFYLVFHGPDLETFKENLRTKEVDLFIAERLVVSVHDEQMRSVDSVKSHINRNPKEAFGQGIDVLVHRLIDIIVDHYDPILDYFAEQMDDLEEQAVNDPTPAMLPLISKRKRELLTLRRVISPQREIVAQLARGDVGFIRESTRVYYRDVLDHLQRVVELVELYRDIVMSARDIYLSSVSNNLNQIMKTLTIISVIALPMTVVTSFFGMNFDDLPGIHSFWAFCVSMCVMLLIVLVLGVWFWKKKWV